MQESAAGCKLMSVRGQKQSDPLRYSAALQVWSVGLTVSQKVSAELVIGFGVLGLTS